MADLFLDSIQVEIREDVSLLIWQEKITAPDCFDEVFVEKGKGKLSKNNNSPAFIYNVENGSNGRQVLTLFENTSYLWTLTGPGKAKIKSAQIKSTLNGTDNKAEWSFTHLSDEPPRGRFRVTNYLGTAEIQIIPESEPLRFEIQSRKFNFHGEYEAMVNDIAGECQQLLLEWDSPTSFNISSDSEKPKETLLEQFLFLKHVLGSGQLDLYLEEISRRPHHVLISEEEWRPGMQVKAERLASDPLRFGRSWQKNGGSNIFQINGYSPGELLQQRRFESFDTAPNRFIQFALGAFREICEQVILAFMDKQGTAYLEAVQMRDTLDVFLAQPFFADVSSLNRLPLESQTLQKREGYRDILLAWLMLDASAALDWPGRQDAYDGTNRDAATLYEYWLYFILRRVLAGNLGMQSLQSESEASSGLEAKPFLCRSDEGGLRINLRGGNESISRFKWKSSTGCELGVHLFYNRTFHKSEDPLASGSFSRSFRPDFTIVFFPASYLETGRWKKAEEEAEKAGKIGYLHFDSKYRIEEFVKLVGADGDKDLNDEHAETRSTDTYKRGDLYKMHTYNDAIKRTAGSYVLYPGKDGESAHHYTRYEEIVPGVGAFKVRPGDETQREVSEKALGDFIGSVLEHHGNTFSRNYRIRHWTHRTIKETAKSYSIPTGTTPSVSVPLQDGLCLLGYVRPEQEALLETKRCFYFYAVRKDGKTEGIDPKIFSAGFFCGRNNDKTLPWIAPVQDLRLVDAKKIAELTGRNVGDVGAQFYYLLDLGEPLPASVLDIAGLVSKRTGNLLILPLSELFTQQTA